MSRRLRDVRLRDDDLATLIGACRDWGESLMDAARMDDGTYDASTKRAAQRYIDAANRAADVLWVARGRPDRPTPVPSRMVPITELGAPETVEDVWKRLDVDDQR